ncbi:MAG: hypothetical protein Pars2KO_09360 [Parasphingorhabdus sp.]
MFKNWLAFCLVTLFLCTTAAEAKRVALVIGNSNYEQTGSLSNPANDVLTVAQSATKAGFDDVIVARDLGMQAFQMKIREFREKATGAELAMVYYAGHGVESRGKNWLIPIDAKLQTSLDLPYEAINLDRILEALEASTIGMVVLDACRNNPFGNTWRSGSRAVQQGLVGVDADDILVIYAAAPGQTADDGNGPNSPFATSLAKRLVQPDLPIQMLGGSIRDDVLSATGGKQRPYVSANITGTPIYLVQSPPKPVATAVAAVGSASTAGNRSRLDALSWRGALSANSSSAYSAYLTEFPDGLFADLAKEKINELRQPVLSGRTTRVASTPPVQSFQAAPAPRTAPPLTAAPATVSSTPPISAFRLPTDPEPTPDPQPQVKQPAAATKPAPAPAPASAPTIDTTSNGSEIKMARSGADLAYVPPSVVEPPLPSLPPTPVLLQKDYPDCKESHQHLVDPLDKANDINACTVKLDQYYENVLNKFREDMNAHQDRISAIYTEKVAGRMEYSAANRDRFYKGMMQEHADSNPDGPNLAVYRAAVELYESDRNYLRDRFCFNTGCEGYTIPENFGFSRMKGYEADSDDDAVEVAANSEKSKKSKKKKKKKKSGGKCKKSRGRGALLGSIFGGLAGKAAGLNKAGTLLASGLGALIVGEIACQLDEKEQKEAAQATQTVAEVEKVGATATWKSPTRSGVSGSSTVTALNTQPNGQKCLTITDVAFIDGEETRVSKQMCRGNKGGRYVIMA